MNAVNSNGIMGTNACNQGHFPCYFFIAKSAYLDEHAPNNVI
jgi:hypothetical protein